MKSSKYGLCNKNLNRLFNIVALNTGGTSDLENKISQCENSNYANYGSKIVPSHPEITCLKLTIEILEQGGKYVQS